MLWTKVCSCCSPALMIDVNGSPHVLSSTLLGCKKPMLLPAPRGLAIDDHRNRPEAHPPTAPRAAHLDRSDVAAQPRGLRAAEAHAGLADSRLDGGLSL